MPEDGSKRKVIGAIAVVAAILVLGGVALVVLRDGEKPGREAALQTVSFQRPEDPGPEPFTEPADVAGRERLPIPAGGSGGGEQPFGGSGSNRVCDRDRLIGFLRGHPDRMREWARVLGVEPTASAVERYIAKLHPVTLTRDTQVTNHAFRNGSAVPFQAILQAGTAVLVDEYGTPVVRCYCGNPLKPAIFVKTARCTGCPPNYHPPRQCDYGREVDYDETYYRRRYYDNGDYDEVFISRQRSGRYRDCYAAYPDPPVVTIVDVYEPPPEPEPAPEPEASPEPEPAPEPEPEPEPAPEPEPPPEEPAPDICHDGLDNEGVPGKIDTEDPNCAGR